MSTGNVSNSNNATSSNDPARASAVAAASSSRQRRRRLRHSPDFKRNPASPTSHTHHPLLPAPAPASVEPADAEPADAEPADAEPADAEPEVRLVDPQPRSEDQVHDQPQDWVQDWVQSTRTDAETGWTNPRSSLRGRLGSVRETAKEAARRRRRARREGFHWYERQWDNRFWGRRMGITPRVVLTLAVLTVVSLFAFLIAARAAGRTSLPPQAVKTTNANPIIIQQQVSEGGSPTPALPSYVVGVWVSNMSPASSGSVLVYVRVTENSGGISDEPVANVPVTITSPSGGVPGGLRGIVKTNSSGLATFTLYYSQSPGLPVYITATASIGKQHVTSTTDFVPA